MNLISAPVPRRKLTGETGSTCQFLAAEASAANSCALTGARKGMAVAFRMKVPVLEASRTRLNLNSPMAKDSGVRWKTKLCWGAPRRVATSGVALLTATRTIPADSIRIVNHPARDALPGTEARREDNSDFFISRGDRRLDMGFGLHPQGFLFGLGSLPGRRQALHHFFASDLRSIFRPVMGFL